MIRDRKERREGGRKNISEQMKIIGVQQVCVPVCVYSPKTQQTE